MKRRSFFKSMLATGVVAAVPGKLLSREEGEVDISKLEKALTEPVLKREFFSSPVKIKSIDLLKSGEEYIVRCESTDGAIGYGISHRTKLNVLYPFFLNRVAPFFVGKDARDLDSLLQEVFVHQSNYKFQGLALWICVASVEFAILDMLGQISGKPVGELFGKTVRRDIELYQANNYRGKSPEFSVAQMVKKVEETGVKAIKFKLGGRMSNDKDSLPGRTEALIPLVRKTFADDMVLYADSNGSYNFEKAVDIGRILEENKIVFYEEPCPFDDLETTKKIADSLSIAIAGGEQESSMRRFLWMIKNNAVQVVQPDLIYYGGFIRSIRVARMAAEAGMSCIPHMSGVGVGYLYVTHFASFIPNADLHMEYKGRSEKIPVYCDTSSLESENGKLRVPTGPGFGITIDPEYIKKSQLITP